MNNTTMIWLMPLWIALCLFFHELGHYLAAKKNYLKPKVGIDKKGFYISHEPTNKEKELEVTKWGVILGYTPITIPILINTTYGFLIILAWTIGNVREIKKIIKETNWN